MANSRVTKERATEIRRILCPVDVSEFSASVLAYAAAFAKLFGSEVTVLHVFAAAVPPAGSATYPAWLLQVPEARKSIADELHLLLAPLSSRRPRVVRRATCPVVTVCARREHS